MRHLYLLTFAWIASAIACDSRERDFIWATEGSLFLVYHHDTEYFNEMGSKNFTVQHLLRYLNYSNNEPKYPFIISTSAFKGYSHHLVQNIEGEGFCSSQQDYPVIALSILSNENYSLVFYGCHVSMKMDVKIYVVSGPKVAHLSNENLWVNHPRISKQASMKFCKCNKSENYLRKCKIDHYDNYVSSNYLTVKILVFATFAFVYFTFICGLELLMNVQTESEVFEFTL